MLVVGGLLGLAQHEAEVREDQFCDLIVKVHEDRQARLTNTTTYLDSPTGRASTGLNDYIREISLPQLRDEVRRERALLPPVCFD